MYIVLSVDAESYRMRMACVKRTVEFASIQLGTEITEEEGVVQSYRIINAQTKPNQNSTSKD